MAEWGLGVVRMYKYIYTYIYILDKEYVHGCMVVGVIVNQLKSTSFRTSMFGV